MSIKRTQLKNFQSHKNTTLEFSPGVNIITGTSDSGKTAIFRALYWLCFNRPSGDAFRSSWGGDTEVSVLLDDFDKPITRKKTKSKNSYQIGDSVFKAMGSDVPDEVKKIVNMNHINLQMQLDRPFLLDASAGEVARHFNNIAHLDVIDRSIQNVERWLREIQQDVKYKKQQGEKWKKELESYSYLSEIETKLERIEKLENLNENEKQKVSILKKIVNDIDSINKEIEGKGSVIKLERSVNYIVSLISDRDKQKDNRDSIAGHIADIKSIDVGIASKKQILSIEKQVNHLIEIISGRNQRIKDKTNISEIISKIRYIKTGIDSLKKKIKLENRVDSLLSVFKDKAENEDKYDRLEKVINNVISMKKLIHKKSVKLKTLEEKFKKAMGNRCPLCGQEIRNG